MISIDILDRLTICPFCEGKLTDSRVEPSISNRCDAVYCMDCPKAYFELSIYRDDSYVLFWESEVYSSDRHTKEKNIIYAIFRDTENIKDNKLSSKLKENHARLANLL